MSHKTFVKILKINVNVFPGFYLFLIVLVPPIIVGVIFNSIAILIALTFTHVALMLKIRSYLYFWRTLTYGIRLLYTILFHRYIFHLSQLNGLRTSYADLSDIHSVEDFYKDKKRSIRRRMTKKVPEKIAKTKVKVSYVSSNWLALENLKVQYIHSKKYNSRIFPIYRIVLGMFSLVGNVTEYRIKGKLVGQGISFLRGNSYTVILYGCVEEASRIGLWFYNIFENIKQAVSMEAQYINGTIEIHKPEAKFNAGFITTDEEELVFRLYGGKFSNFPNSFRGKEKISRQDQELKN